MKNKTEIDRIVEKFYQPSFKTYYVNSIDGTELVRPFGVFISLGMASSKETIHSIASRLKNYNLDAVVAELASKKTSYGYLNYVTSTKNPKQYRQEYKKGMMNEEESKVELEKLRSQLDSGADPEIMDALLREISSLTNCLEKINDDKYIMKGTDGNYRVYSYNVNYKKDGEKDLRLGIFVN